MNNDLEKAKKTFSLESEKSNDDSKMEKLVKQLSEPTQQDDCISDCKEEPEECCDSCEMPRYRSHKEVWGLKIKSIVFDSDLARETGRETDGSAIITPEEDGYAPFKVDASYVRKHNPVVGGYYVVYKDGYKSFSPAEAFEEGNTKISELPLHISNPFEWMKQWVDAYHRDNGGVNGSDFMKWVNNQPMTCG